MKTRQHWALFLNLLTVAILSKASASDDRCVECTRQSKIPSRWNYKNERVPIILILCTVNNNCSINIDNLVNNEESEVSASLTSLDFRFTCSSTGTHIDFDSTQTKNDSLFIHIRVDRCSTTWDDIDTVGSAYHLLEVEMVLTSSSPVLSVAKRLPGLSELYSLRLIFMNFNGMARLEDSFPYKNEPMTNLSSLHVQCLTNSTHKTFCTPGMVSYDATKLSSAFPQLQVIALSGVYALNRSKPINFPWDNETRRRPFNMSESSFSRRIVTQAYIENVEGSVLPRKFSYCDQKDVNLAQVCPFGKSLDTIVFQRDSITNIPPKCFSPRPNTTSELYFLDLSGNNLTELPDGVFCGLQSLEALHIAKSNVHNLAHDLFNDLVSLRILDLTDNSISSIQKGLFSKLASLTKLFLHGNDLHTFETYSLPEFSTSLTFVDVRWNNLTHIPYDCLSLPNLSLCDCDHNNITLYDLENITNHFDPFNMQIVQVLPYYNGTYSNIDVGVIHGSTMSLISLRNNSIHKVNFNASWPINTMKRFSTLLNFFELNMDEIGTCDCHLYQLKLFIKDCKAKDLIRDAAYSHVQFVGEENFQSWRCQVHRLLRANITFAPFLDVPDESFACQLSREHVGCPTGCECFNRASDSSIESTADPAR